MTASFELYTAPYNFVTESAIKKKGYGQPSVLSVPIYLQYTKSKSDHTIFLFLVTKKQGTIVYLKYTVHIFMCRDPITLIEGSNY